MYMSVFSTAGWILRLARHGRSCCMTVSPWLVLLVAFALPTVLTASWRPGHRTRRRRGRRVARSPGASPLPAGHDRAARQGGAARAGSDRDLVEQRQRGMARLVRARGAGALVERVLAHDRVGDLRRRVRRRGRVRHVGARRVGRGGAARARRGQPAVAVRRRDRRRDRVPPRHLARRRAPARVARGLRAGARRARRSTRARIASKTASGSTTSRSATPAPTGSCSTTSSLDLPGRNGRRDRRRERRGQVDAREAAVPLLPTGAGHDHRRRRRSRAHARGGVARPAGRRVPGLLPLRAASRRRPSASAISSGSTTDPRSTPRSTRAGAGDVVDRLARGLDTQLGVTWDDGVEVSFGQWQKLALARGFMRDQPLLARARRADGRARRRDRARAVRALRRLGPQRRRAPTTGRITVLVSHRFSTVRMADLIVVLDGARVVEVGHARRADRATAASTPSSTASRPPRTARTGRARIDRPPRGIASVTGEPSTGRFASTTSVAVSDGARASTMPEP